MSYQGIGVDAIQAKLKERRGEQSGPSYEDLQAQYFQQNPKAKFGDFYHWVCRNAPDAHQDYLRRKNPGKLIEPK